MKDLETDRLLIRAFRADDLDGFAALMDDAFGTVASREALGEQVGVLECSSEAGM